MEVGHERNFKRSIHRRKKLDVTYSEFLRILRNVVAESDAQTAELAAQAAELARMRRALEEYGMHTHNCNYWDADKLRDEFCDCGYAAALSQGAGEGE